MKIQVDYKNDKEWQLWNHNAKKRILGVDCSAKTLVPKEIERSTPTSSLFLQEEISEPTFVSETHLQLHDDLLSSPYASLASMASLSPPSWDGQDNEVNKSAQSAPTSNNSRSPSYIQDTRKYLQRGQHQTIDLDDDSAIDTELGNEKVSKAYSSEMR
jgi:hypothetical protein